MEDGIDSKKGRSQRQNVGKEERRRFGFRHKKSLSIQTLAKKSTETAGRRPRYKEVSIKKTVFLLGEHKKTPSPSRRRRYALRVFREWTEN